MDNFLTWFGLVNNKTVLHWVVLWMFTVFPVYVFVTCSKFTFKVISQEILSKRWLMLKVFLVVGLLTPLMAAGIVKIFSGFHMSLVLGGIMLIASTAPGDPFDLLDAHGKKGSMLMASTVMVLLVLLMPLTVPCWMWVFSHWFPLHLAAAPVNIFTKVSVLVIVPMVTGLVFRQLLPKLTDKLELILHGYFKISAITILIFFLPGALGKIATVAGLAGCIAMFIVTTLTLFTGYYVARGSDRKERISIALACSLGNMAAVFCIAYHGYPELSKNNTFLMTVLGWVMMRWFGIYAWYFFMKFRLARRGESLG